MPKRVLEAQTPAQRAQKRRTLGTLRQLTVQPQTRQRYNKAIDQFMAHLKANAIKLPEKRDLLDPLVCDYVEHLWYTGQGRGLANDTLAGLQDLDPKIKGYLPGSWRLLKTWGVNEVPARAPPLPEPVLHAMCGWAFFHNHITFGISLLIGFYGMLRTGEILSLTRRNLSSHSSQEKVLISLGLTKSGKRAGAAESVILGYDKAVKTVQKWMTLATTSHSLSRNPGNWRKLFNDALSGLRLTQYNFRPYSLRRGGATWWFSRHHSLDQILIQGRWQAVKTARIYLNEGLALLAELKIPTTDPHIAPFLRLFSAKVSTGSFATLEPSPKVERSGGRGKGRKRPNNFVKKSFFVGTVLKGVRISLRARGSGPFELIPP